MDDETVNGALVVAVMAACIWVGSANLAAPVPMPAQCAADPMNDPAKLAIITLGRLSDASTTASFDGKRLELAYRCLNIEELAELVPAVFRRFAQVAEIEVIGRGSPQHVRGKTPETFDEPFMNVIFTRSNGEAVKVTYSSLPKRAEAEFWAPPSRYRGHAPGRE
jgi:hypothetical protein